MAKNCHRLRLIRKGRERHFSPVRPEKDNDEYIAKGISESLKEYNKVRKGKAQSRPVEDLLNKLIALRPSRVSIKSSNGCQNDTVR